MYPHLGTVGGDLVAVSQKYVERLNRDVKAAAPFSDSPPPLCWKLLDITSSKHLHVDIWMWACGLLAHRLKHHCAPLSLRRFIYSSSSQYDNRFDDILRWCSVVYYIPAFNELSTELWVFSLTLEEEKVFNRWFPSWDQNIPLEEHHCCD